MRRLLLIPALALALAASACGNGYDTAESACAAAGSTVSKGPIDNGGGSAYAICADNSYAENVDGDGDAWFVRGLAGPGGQAPYGDDDEFEGYEDDD